MLTLRPTGFSSLSTFPQMERLVDSFFSQPALSGPGAARAFPALNVWEDEQALHIEAELPGFTMENLEIAAIGNQLTIAGTRQETLPENATFHRRERSSGGASQFKRSLRIGVPIDAENVKATLERGVLTLTLPKAPEAKPRKIQVRSA